MCSSEAAWWCSRQCCNLTARRPWVQFPARPPRILSVWVSSVFLSLSKDIPIGVCVSALWWTVCFSMSARIRSNPCSKLFSFIYFLIFQFSFSLTILPVLCYILIWSNLLILVSFYFILVLFIWILWGYYYWLLIMMKECMMKIWLTKWLAPGAKSMQSKTVSGLCLWRSGCAAVSLLLLSQLLEFFMCFSVRAS